MSPPALRAHPTAWLCLALLAVFFIWLRWDTHPATYFADELIPRAVVQHMRDSHTLDTNWQHADWRGDYAGNFYNLQQYNFSSYHTALLFCRLLANTSGLPAIPDLVLYRFASLVFQLVTLLFIFLASLRLAGAMSAIIAVSFLALIPQAVVDAHYARPESFSMMLVAVALWLALQPGKPNRIACEAAVWGIAFACKFSFFPMALLSAGARFYQNRSATTGCWWIAGFTAGVAVSAPYILMDPAGFLHGIHLLLGQYKAGDTANAILPSAHLLFPYLAAFFGAPALLLLLVPMLSAESRIRCLALCILPVTMFYLLAFARQGVFFERNISHLLPLWAILFGAGCVTATAAFSKNWRIGIAFLICTASLAWPLYLSLEINRLVFRQPDIVKNITSQFEQEIQSRLPGTRVVTPALTADMASLDQLPAHVIPRFPAWKIDDMAMLDHALQQRGYQQLNYLPLPLGFLPYNQLQVNHFPAGYRYYQHSGTPTIRNKQ